MLKTLSLGLFVFSSLASSLPLDLQVSPPPELSALENEKARLNLVNRNMDEFVQAHATLKHADKILVDEIMPSVSAIVADYEAWKDDLFLIKAILSDVDQLTGPQQDQYRAKIIEVMGSLYTIRKESKDVRARIASIAGEIFAIRHFEQTFITANDSDEFPTNLDVLSQVNNYKANMLTAYENTKSIIGLDVENGMAQSINTTKEIVDELFLIRSLEYPELEQQLILLREFTISEEVIRPRLKEVQESKYLISNTIDVERRPYAALDMYTALVTRVNELNAQITASGLSQSHIDSGVAQLTGELAEAHDYIDQPVYFPSKVKRRYSLLTPVVDICKDVTHELRYLYNCGVLKGIYGFDQELILAFDEEKLRYLETQMDYIFAGAMGND